MTLGFTTSSHTQTAFYKLLTLQHIFYQHAPSCANQCMCLITTSTILCIRKTRTADELFRALSLVWNIMSIQWTAESMSCRSSLRSFKDVLILFSPQNSSHSILTTWKCHLSLMSICYSKLNIFSGKLLLMSLELCYLQLCLIVQRDRNAKLLKKVTLL